MTATLSTANLTPAQTRMLVFLRSVSKFQSGSAVFNG
jgi:hypothetical protein